VSFNRVAEVLAVNEEGDGVGRVEEGEVEIVEPGVGGEDEK